VVLTFDDGWHDFYTEAWPELRSFGYPATVYQTTYYSLDQKPVFDTACSYLLWKGRGQTLQDRALTGTGQAFALDSPASRHSTFEAIAGRLRRAGASAAEKDGVLAKLAAHLGIDWDQMLQSRLLRLMTLSEVAEISRNGVDVQLHTHRHRLPSERNAFLNEIRHNRDLLEVATGQRAVHFCYPNGEYRREWPGWLREAGVVSATTCEPGWVTRQEERLLLSRAVDSCTVSSARFESWLSGLGLWFSAYKRKARSLSGHRGRSSTRTEVSHEREPAGPIGQRAVARVVEGR
jgi:peptidoglycan/xylan/chitin deacetylase (PgdA/CDA1 family)